MNAMASQIIGVSIDYCTICSGADQRKHHISRHWPLWEEFPSQTVGNVENVSIW